MAKKKRAAKKRPQKKKVAIKKKSARKRASVKRKPVKKRKPAKKRKPVPRKRKAAKGRQLIKQVEKSSVERVMAGKRRRRRVASKRRKRRVVLAGAGRRRRSVGGEGFGSKGLLIGLGLGALAIYLITNKTAATTTPGGAYTLPPIAQTSNYTRNTQSNDIINYAIAGGLAIDAIIKLIDRLNSSTDQDVENIYDRVTTTGDFGTYV